MRAIRGDSPDGYASLDQIEFSKETEASNCLVEPPFAEPPTCEPGQFECTSTKTCIPFVSLDTLYCKDTNRRIRKAEFIYICGSKNGSCSSTVNTSEV